MISKKFIFIVSIFIILIFIVSCSDKVSTEKIEREDKFTLSIGNMDNELDFFSRDGIPFSLDTDIFMDNGLFYISNGNGKKIMKFNSYGDLLSNISPIRQLDSSLHNSNLWNFHKPGSISKSNNFLYIYDTIEYDAALGDNYIDKSNDLTLDKTDIDKHILNEQIVSIFDNEGNYIDYIGQEGLKSTPFPFINNIYTDFLNRLIVITQTTYFWSIYRFTEGGILIDKIDIDLGYLPQLEEKSDTITQINNIIPDRNNDRVLVELTFYNRTIDDKTGATISMDFIKSRVYYFDLINKTYISWMDSPVSKNIDENNQQLYELIDIVKGKYLLFSSITLDGSSQFLTITNENGYIIGEYNLNIDNSNIIYKNFYTTLKEGILTGILCTDYAAGIVLWRTDKIFEEDIN